MEQEDEINNNIFQEFQSIISIEKIFSFYKECLLYNDKYNNSEKINKLTKSKFIKMCEIIFSSEKKFNFIYNLIFERFKEIKCSFIKHYNNKVNNKNDYYYSLSEVYSTGKIDCYVVELFLCAIAKTKFKIKIETMFYITDFDLDGLINEKEIKKLIYTINQIFSEESSQFSSDSSLILQSLSAIKAKKSYYNILYGEGNLYEKLNSKNYVNFNEFYEAISKIQNYKYEIIPTFINIKKCLLSKRNELQFLLDPKNKNYFSEISDELINKANLNIFTPPSFSNTFLKNCFDSKEKQREKKPISFREKNIKIIKEKSEKARMIKIRNLQNSLNNGKNIYKSLILQKSTSPIFKRNYNILNNIKLHKIYRNKSFLLPSQFFKDINNIKNSVNNFKNNDSQKKIKRMKDTISLYPNKDNNSDNLNNNNNYNNQSNINSLSISLRGNPKKFFKRSNYSIKPNSIKNKFLENFNKLNNTNFEELKVKEKNNKQNNSMKLTERGLYSKFNNLVFTPCIILPKTTKNNKKNFLKKINLKTNENPNGVLKDEYSLKPLEEIKNEISFNLNLHKKLGDKNGINTIIQIENEINEIKQRFYINNLRNNN